MTIKTLSILHLAKIYTKYTEINPIVVQPEEEI